MDGVLADFDALAHETLGPTPEQAADAQAKARWPHEQWERLKQVEHFYYVLPKTAMADDLVNIARKFRDQAGWQLRALTAIPQRNDVPEVFDDKFRWMQERYPDIPVYFGPYSRDKHLHVKQAGDILVDDRKDNCDQWDQAGGHAVRELATNYPDVLAQLQRILETELGR